MQETSFFVAVYLNTITRIFLVVCYVTILRKNGFFSLLCFHRHLLFHHNLCLFFYHTGNGLDLGYKGTTENKNIVVKIWFYIIGMDYLYIDSIWYPSKYILRKHIFHDSVHCNPCLSIDKENKLNLSGFLDICANGCPLCTSYSDNLNLVKYLSYLML